MNQTIYAFDQFQLDVQKRLLLRDGQPVQLTSKAFDLLLALIESGGREITKDELMKTVWANQIVEDANLTVTMSHVRKALGEKAGEHRFIVTIPGRGYRFISELKVPEGFIIEKHTVSEIIIEHEIENDNGFSGAPSGETKLISQPTAITNQVNTEIAERKDGVTPRTAFKYFMALLCVLVSIVLVFGAYKFFSRKHREPFKKITLKRLTNSGKVACAAISPDGKLIAYVLSENEGNSLWVQQVGTASKIQVAQPVKAEFWGLTFTPNSEYIYYNLFLADKVNPELYRVPSLGGVTEKIPVIAPFITFAPDGKHFAYPIPDSAAGFNYLMVADADGSNSKEIIRKKHPNSFEIEGRVASWSPDGEIVACTVNHFETDASYSSIVGINVKDGTEVSLGAQQWHEVNTIEWLKDGSGLLISARDKEWEENRIWFLSYPEGEARTLTNDVSAYYWLSASQNGETLAALQTNTLNNISVGEVNKDFKTYKDIVSEVGYLGPLVWTPDGKIVFRSSKDGISNLWITDENGESYKQLTTNAQVSDLGLCITPDGKQLVFTSWLSGKANLWRVDSDGGNMRQLTNGTADAHARCSPDGQWAVYQNGLFANPSLWKVPINGDAPVRITDFRAKWPAVSYDGSRIAYFYMTNDKWRIGIVSSDGKTILQQLDVPPTLLGRPIYWSKNNQSLMYISTVGNVCNIWSLPLDGGQPKQITNFDSYSIDDFSLSPDGKRLAVVRGTKLSDVVLIENSLQP